METFVRNSGRRHLRRRKKQKQMKLLRNSAQSLGIPKLVKQNKNGKRVKKITEQCTGSLIKGPSEQDISLNSNCGKDLAECGQGEENRFEQTITLTDNENSIHISKSNALVVPSFEVQGKDDVIDLSKDFPDRNEVIDLTEAVNTRKSCCSAKNSPEPTVIDITEDDVKNQSSCSDEVFVIGTFRRNSNSVKKCKTPVFNPLSNRLNKFNNLIHGCEKLKSKHGMKQLVLGKINKKNRKCSMKHSKKPKENLTEVGENIYVKSPVAFPSNGLRPIIIDGSNVAFVHSDCNFSCKRLEICINYFKEKGHRVTAFVPQYRTNLHRSDDPELLKRLERQGDVILTPSKKVDGRNIVPYDDRFIVQTAVLKGGIIVTRDNYNDLLKENPAWAETIKYRTLAFTWVDDVLMFPKDPLGEYGPSLEEFLRFH